ncbi:MAG: hypothetical protein IPF87_24370 [Gemmatimonadetes bacterium]|jgi:hypothetical protein|nr:hypothetical protein [Gemmatimonadota bacterium]MCC7322185.1 hypothetical protein [Gemmatimonadaceae bacterium]MBK6459170.1 hypothetical protein [Gemmatimonadota bacterium]MBK6845650.1 hypothetical protein [Gemmatimonadota bacterium]MBK7832872.1 hypothetical protein [Gemmatimonadota bacterium]
MLEPSSQLNRLQARFDRLASGVDKSGSSWLAHTAILDHLAASRTRAEAAGWTACDVERLGGMGRLRLVGVAPGQPLRGEFPEPI